MIFQDMYNSYEVLSNDGGLAVRLPSELLADYKTICTNQAKTTRLLLIHFLYHGQYQDNSILYDSQEFTRLYNSYEVLPNDNKLAIKLPIKLLEDFKEKASNQNKVLRMLLIQYIYTQRQKA